MTSDSAISMATHVTTWESKQHKQVDKIRQRMAAETPTRDARARGYAGILTRTCLPTRLWHFWLRSGICWKVRAKGDFRSVWWQRMIKPLECSRKL